MYHLQLFEKQQEFEEIIVRVHAGSYHYLWKITKKYHPPSFQSEERSKVSGYLEEYKRFSSVISMDSKIVTISPALDSPGLRNPIRFGNAWFKWNMKEWGSQHSHSWHSSKQFWGRSISRTLSTLPSFHRDKKVARFPQIAWSDEEFPNAWQMHAGSLQDICWMESNLVFNLISDL